MTAVIVFIVYTIIITLIAKHASRPIPDVVKKNGTWIYNRHIKAGEIINIPGECWQDVNSTIYTIDENPTIQKDTQ